MSDLVGNPNCWFSHAQAQICCLTVFAAQTWLKVLFEDGKRGTVTFKDNENCQRFLQAIIMNTP